MVQKGITAIVKQARQFLDHLDTQEFLFYTMLFLSLFAVSFGSFIYLTYSRITQYTVQLRQLERELRKTETLLSQHKALIAQKQYVEDLLTQTPNFFIGKAYQDILKKVGLEHNQDEEPIATEGEIIADNREILLRSVLQSITMKKLANLLELVATEKRLYPKGIEISKPGAAHTIDVELTIATLEKRS